jgi:Flp pilus assembly protein TadG
MKRQNQSTRRTAAHLVEFALVIPVVLSLLFTILESCRYMMIKQIAENAAREGARYAIARTDTLQTNCTTSTIQGVVQGYLSNANVSLDNLAVTIYKANQAGQPMDLNNNVVATPALAAAFDQTKFGDYIYVELKGKYKSVLPNFLSAVGGIDIIASSVMCSEGN